MHQEVHRRKLSLTAQVLRAMLMAAVCALLGNPLIYAESPEGSPAASSAPDQALIILATLDVPSFHEAIALVQNHGGEVPLAFPPNAFVATLTPRVKRALNRHSTVIGVETGSLDPAMFVDFGGQVEVAVDIWNTMFRGAPDANIPQAPAAPAPQPNAPDFLIPPLEPSGSSLDIDAPALGAPTSTQTSEFMAGTIVYSVIFIESSGGTGSCSPADPQTENWSASRRSTVLVEISAGLAFWTSRTGRPRPLTFMLDNRGARATSCEPITRSSSDEGQWIADALTALGFPATPSNYFGVARSFAHSRRTALGANWGFIIFVVDSLNDLDGSFSDGRNAYAYLNGPFMVLTYDNDGWGIGRMNLVALHEAGHIFGALDEYASSGCSTADRWGYLTVANASCNNGGITSDISVMGEGSELENPSANVSTSARGAIGWRNPSGNIVDVVRTATVSLTRYNPDPTTDRTPTYSAIAGNRPFPPGGCNTLGGICYRTPSPVTISKVRRAQWKLDGGSFTSTGVTPNDGAFNEETGEAYRFTPTAAVSARTHTFYTRSTNNFGHTSSTVSDRLTIR